MTKDSGKEQGRGRRFAMPKVSNLPEGDALARRPGPMAVAGRESAESLTRIAEEQAEQRRRNAEEAELFRAARSAGLVLRRLPVDAIGADSLPRDRMDLEAVAASAEMEELKASLRLRGQREAIEVWSTGEGSWQLKSGWRRVEALRQLFAETGDDRFATVIARVDEGPSERMALYIDMVEENAIREDVSFAEMAHVAIEMARDPLAGASGVEDAVNRLYGALQKTKRSNIRRFVDLLLAVGDVLPAPRDIPKNLGADAARAIYADKARLAALRARLKGARDAAAQNAALAAAVADAQAAMKGEEAPPAPAPREARPGRKFEFHHQGMKVTARPGEVRIRCEEDFAEMSRDRLEAAIAAFRSALAG
jgi:ParB family chromosome partitioning protein